ncbi:protein of unknown function [Micromonospora pattaloongensis]|uniref:DUF4360 domain-containing protein n=1 Tax=Micromonospora pattaloongensis TaxID=405436 RepID=A0A1H3QRS7_9ACTN|nr:DUF4360 domain-containing protein [Micromonospora pattaloongensis]SDZ15771.1 protein of unknown function [Micromonospora pattaloongensis]
MLESLATAGLALALAVAPVLTEQSSPPPTERITIDVVTVNGSGCPAGTAAVAPAADNTAFTVTYSDYLAQVGVGAKPTDFRKNCQLNLRIHVPQGFTYAIAQADYRGFAHLARGATGLQRANYYFQGTSPTVPRSHSFAGPYSDNWQTTDKTEVAEIVWAPCGEDRNLNVNTELRVSAGSSDPTKTTSFMAMDSTDGSVGTVYHLAWKQCDE